MHGFKGSLLILYNIANQRGLRNRSLEKNPGYAICRSEPIFFFERQPAPFRYDTRVPDFKHTYVTAVKTVSKQCKHLIYRVNRARRARAARTRGLNTYHVISRYRLRPG